MPRYPVLSADWFHSSVSFNSLRFLPKSPDFPALPARTVKFHRQYSTRQEAILDITEYIEIFYNRQRRQKKLDYLSPAAFEQRFYKQQLVQEIGVHY
jgi:transposase InsO family protein